MSPGLVSRAIGLCAALAVTLVLAGASPAAAQCGGTQLCAAGAGDCTISANCTITLPAPGLNIDLGARRLVINKDLTISGPENAGLTVSAGEVVINGGTMSAPGANSIAGGISIFSATSVTVQSGALIDVTAGLGAGFVDIEALGGDMTFAGRIKANGNGTRQGFGGDVTLFATGSMTVTGTTMDVSGGDMAGGGSITIDALNGSLFVSTPLKATGGDGGDIELSAGTTLQTTSSAELNVNSNGDAGSAGSIDVSSFDALTLGGDSIGTGSATDFREEGRTGGDGADLDVFAENGNVAINGKVEINGAPGGAGGSVDIYAGGNLTFGKALLSQSDGVDGLGGDVLLTSGGTMSLPQTVDVRGRTGTGGSIEADAGGDLTVSASLIADGDFQGGMIFLSACALNVTGPAQLSAQGAGAFPAASNVLQASSTMTIAGTLKAGSQNLLQYRQAPAPSVTGPNTPPANKVLEPTLPCCVSCPVTTTTTTTTSTTLLTTTSTTHTTTTVVTSTTTTTVPSVCGNGVVTGVEQCDDGNTVGGDCCSPTCTFEAANSPCADDSNPCTRDVCNATGACTHPAGNAGASCRAAAGACDQPETCSGTSASCPADAKSTGVCRPAAGPCDQAESCDGASNVCPPDGFSPAGTSCRSAAGACDLEETCTGTGPACPPDALAPANTPCRAATGVCDVAETCTGTGAACPADGFVPDGTTCGDACTVGGTCQGGVCSGQSQVACGPCETCDPAGGCVTGPRPLCRQPVQSAKAQFKVKDSLKGPKNDQLLWKWIKGAQTQLGDFGDPVSSDGVTLCVFDRSQATPGLLFRAAVPAGGLCGTKPCWTGNDKGFKFKSSTGQADGIVNLTMKPGVAGKSKIILKAKGLGLTERPFGLPTPSLPLPLTVQLQSENGQCWEASYQRSGVKKNAGETFDGKAE
jgi:cysteine-rich repeat protein